MALSIPRKNLSDMVLYVWKIIGLPSVSFQDLVYLLSYKLFLYDTIAATKFVNSAIEEGLLLKDSNEHLSLSGVLKEKLENWQIQRKEEISEKLKSIKIVKRMENTSKDKLNDFTLLFKPFVDEATLTRTASILQSDITYEMNDLDRGVIKVKVKGSKEIPYTIQINLDNKYIHHDCHDYETRKSKSKKFCKHLAKLFLILKDEDEEKATKLLNKIADQINEWNFD
ncbi:MAG: hypothetical protein EU533_03810 [Promethearchaeota archaeon]|nr:MAG: hypothetical protein EU533_03810 [Candidatus Lokiarchaeota archaeon]